MTIRKAVVCPFAVATIICAFTPAFSQSSMGIEGRLARITATEVSIENGSTYKIDGQTRCFDAQQVKLTCATLAAVGYADAARITVVGDTARRIDILLLQQ
jgi:hypothetical protein